MLGCSDVLFSHTGRMHARSKIKEKHEPARAPSIYDDAPSARWLLLDSDVIFMSTPIDMRLLRMRQRRPDACISICMPVCLPARLPACQQNGHGLFLIHSATFPRRCDACASAPKSRLDVSFHVRAQPSHRSENKQSTIPASEHALVVQPWFFVCVLFSLLSSSLATLSPPLWCADVVVERRRLRTTTSSSSASFERVFESMTWIEFKTLMWVCSFTLWVAVC